MIQLFVTAALLAGGSPPPLRPTRAERGPAIDGRIDDAAWADAAPATAFVQKFPDEGQPPSEATTVRVLYDDDAIYVAVDCPQEHSPLVARLTRRDRVV